VVAGIPYSSSVLCGRRTEKTLPSPGSFSRGFASDRYLNMLCVVRQPDWHGVHLQRPRHPFYLLPVTAKYEVRLEERLEHRVSGSGGWGQEVVDNGRRECPVALCSRPGAISSAES
jgi:hypothetical protein